MSADPALHPVVRARWLILAVFVAVCAWVVPGLWDLRNDDDVLAFLPPDHPDVVGFHEVAKRFGMLEVALVGIAPPDGDVFTKERIDAVRQLEQQLEELPGVRLALGFADLPNPVVNEGGLEVAPLVPEGFTDPQAVRERVLASRDAVGNFVSSDGAAAMVLVFLLPRDGDGPEAFAKRREVLRSIRTLTEQLWDGEVHFGGAPFVEVEASELSRRDIERLSPIVIAVLTIASAVLLRSIAAALLNLLFTGLGVLVIVAAHGRFGEPLTIVSSSIPVMMVALGGAFGMHVLAGYQRQRGDSMSRASAAISELWLPVLLSGLTTAVAFFALVVMPQVPMQRFGVAAGLGMVVLLTMAMLVLPALLAVLPSGAMQTRDEVAFPRPPRLPLAVLAALGIVGGVLNLRMEADPDTGNVFSEDSAPRRANRFFERNFGGATFLQVAVEADLGEAEVLRTIRDLTEEIAAVEGVVDVRSVIEPVTVLDEAMGARKGIPSDTPKARRLLTYLIGHPAMAQLMSEDADAALVHVKLGALSGKEQVAVAERVRALMDAKNGDFRVGPITNADIAKARREAVARRIEVLTGKPVDRAVLDPSAPVALSPALTKEIEKLRDEILDPEEGALAITLPETERTALTAAKLLTPRGEALVKVMKETLPTAAAQDPEGLEAAAEHLGTWIDEATAKFRVDGWCAALELEDCKAWGPALSEVEDPEGRVPAGLELADARDVRLEMRLTGQPVIGAAFAESVTTSMWQSTLVSWIALALVLVAARSLFALVPATWTLLLAGGILGALSVPVSVATSMITCIALGAGVDFAIHLGFRARAIASARSAKSSTEGVASDGGPSTTETAATTANASHSQGLAPGGELDAGEQAVVDLGGVIMASAVQLALAFLVLAASSMPPLRHFGIGLAIGLFVAALGAVWLTPVLQRRNAAK